MKDKKSLIYLSIALVIILGLILYFFVIKKGQEESMVEEPFQEEKTFEEAREEIIKSLTAPVPEEDIEIPEDIIQSLTAPQTEEPQPVGTEQKKLEKVPEDVIQSLTAPE